MGSALIHCCHLRASVQSQVCLILDLDLLDKGLILEAISMCAGRWPEGDWVRKEGDHLGLGIKHKNILSKSIS